MEITIVKNQMEKKMENLMETGIIINSLMGGYIGGCIGDYCRANKGGYYEFRL